MATPKQVNYALYLLNEAGYPTKWMSSDHTPLGATMRERSGTVRDWLTDMEFTRVSNLIDELKERIADQP